MDLKFKNARQAKWAVTWWNPAVQTRPALDCFSFVPVSTLQRRKSLLSYIRERKYTVNVQCIIIVIITLFNVGTVLLRVIYQLNFIVLMYITQISCYI
jgi:hypothetical protein